MNILIIIPVRGQSKTIPRKNIRLMNGKPLLVYSIQTALSLQKGEFSKIYNTDVVVDTEDAEIAEIASSYGAKVVMRPQELAGDAVTLDPVIYHALVSREEEMRKTYDIVITMQATSPTLKKETFQAAVNEFISSDADTMISAVNEPHLSWKYEAGQLVAAYTERLNRQQLPAHLKETGGFLLSKRHCITENSRIGKNITVFLLPEKEAVDIDTAYDWMLCESILNSKKIILRADGEEQLGMGHIYRCLSIAYHLTGHELLFVTKRQCALGAKKLQESFFQTALIDKNEDIFSIIDQFQPDIVINDILDTTLSYMHTMRKKTARIINFEDRGEGAVYADCVINALYSRQQHQNVYQGFQYFFIRDEFLEAIPKTFSEKVNNIVVLFGGSDPSNLTGRAYRILKQITETYQELEVHIITGFGYPYELINDPKHRIYIHRDVRRVSSYLSKADLALTSQGRTIYELACMGVPSIVLAQNEREQEHTFAAISNGYINLGLGRAQTDSCIQATIEWMIQAANVRRQMHDLLLKKDFKQGQKQVIRLILGE